MTKENNVTTKSHNWSNDKYHYQVMSEVRKDRKFRITVKTISIIDPESEIFIRSFWMDHTSLDRRIFGRTMKDTYDSKIYGIILDICGKHILSDPIFFHLYDDEHNGANLSTYCTYCNSDLKLNCGRLELFDSGSIVFRRIESSEIELVDRFIGRALGFIDDVKNSEFWRSVCHNVRSFYVLQFCELIKLHSLICNSHLAKIISEYVL